MLARKLVTVDSLPDSPFRNLDQDAVICIDVLRATTTLVTAVAQGRRAFPAASVEQARQIAASLPDPMLAGEVHGGKPDGFEITNSPATLARRSDHQRPMVLVSPSGTPLVTNAEGCRVAYVACLRNLAATARWAAEHHDRVAVLAAGSHAELRCEDQMAAAWIAEHLIAHGFDVQDQRTADLVQRWSGASLLLASWGNSAEYLRRSGQIADLEYVLGHVDDLDLICRYEAGEVVIANTLPARAAAKHRGASRSFPAGSKVTQMRGPVHQALPANPRIAAFAPRHAEAGGH